MWTTLTDKLLPTITWTLVHSLWQGLILTALAGIVMVLTRRSTAAVRYTALCTLFFLFLGGVLLTFIMEWNGEIEPAVKYIASDKAGSYSILSMDQLKSVTTSFLDQNAGLIVLAWMLILLFQAGKMLREVIYIRELRNSRTKMLGQLWISKLQALAQGLDIKKFVLLVESSAVKVPIVIGYFKPMVMLPIGMVNHLSPGEMEAVLLHELAHIRRHDYLVNYAQRITESLLFFNPAVLWVSALLRAEREACCDEVAISHTGNKLQFVEALISCKEYASQTPGFSLGLFGNRNVLVHRLNRIVSGRNKALSPFEASFFVGSIVGLALILSGWKEVKSEAFQSPTLITANSYPQRVLVNQTVEKAPEKQKKETGIIIKPEGPASPNKLLTHPKKHQAREIISAIHIDEVVPELQKASTLHIDVLPVDRITTQKDSREEIEQRRLQVDFDRMQAEKARHQAQIHRAEAALHRQQADRDRQIAAQHREKAERDRLQADKDRAEIRKLREQVARYRQTELAQ